TKDQAVRVPTLYDKAHDSGMKTAAIVWPCCTGAKTLDWLIPDCKREDLHARFTTPGLAKELAAAGIDIAPLGKWGWSKEHVMDRDEVNSRVACYLLEKHRPNLMMIHFNTPDTIEHAFGPHTPEAFKAVNHSDQRIKEVWDALQKPGLKGESALFVV